MGLQFTIVKNDALIVSVIFFICTAVVFLIGKVFGPWYGIGTLFLMILVLNVIYGLCTGKWLEFWR